MNQSIKQTINQFKDEVQKVVDFRIVLGCFLLGKILPSDILIPLQKTRLLLTNILFSSCNKIVRAIAGDEKNTHLTVLFLPVILQNGEGGGGGGGGKREKYRPISGVIMYDVVLNKIVGKKYTFLSLY